MICGVCEDDDDIGKRLVTPRYSPPTMNLRMVNRKTWWMQMVIVTFSLEYLSRSHVNLQQWKDAFMI